MGRRHTRQAQAETAQATTTRTKESNHADQITEALDTYQAARTLPLLMPLSALLVLSACSAPPKAAPLNTALCPRPAALSATVSQAMRPDSMPVLRMADVWLNSSAQLLSSETSSSSYSPMSSAPTARSPNATMQPAPTPSAEP
jgi:hypothetical protein